MKIILKITLDEADIVNLKILHGNLKSINIYLKKGYEVNIGIFGLLKFKNKLFLLKLLLRQRHHIIYHQKV